MFGDVNFFEAAEEVVVVVVGKEVGSQFSPHRIVVSRGTNTKKDTIYTRHRQSTLDRRYLTPYYENVPPKLFLLTLFWEFVMFFQLLSYPHHSTIPQRNKCFMSGKIRHFLTYNSYFSGHKAFVWLWNSG
jgi:hypothetical protein